jgi:diaminohydroxyphosphoribosylaminopyrimidine deaminase/5-amino-6-(5-phosphoribosylamino)uracil reductase
MDAILVGTNTALTDDPALTNRHWPGKSPLRIVMDRHRRLPDNLKLFDGSTPTWVVTEDKRLKDISSKTLRFIELDFDDNLLGKLLGLLFEQQISSLIVEGGADTINRFLNQNLWDEAAIFSAPNRLGTGILAPRPVGHVVATHQLGSDTLTILRNAHGGR